MEDGEDPYAILGVTKDSSDDDIKRAYRKLALKNHPDKQPSEEERQRATSVFAKIAEAYQLVKDADARTKLDIQKQMKEKGYYTVPVDKNSSTTTSTKQNGAKTATRRGSTGAPTTSSTTTFTTSQSSVPTTSTSTPTSQSRPTKRNPFRPSNRRGSTGTPSGKSFSPGGQGDPGITFSFSSSNFDPNRDDPYETFKKIYKEEYGVDFDPNNVPESPKKPLGTRFKGSPKKVSGVVSDVASPKRQVVPGGLVSPKTKPSRSPAKMASQTSPSKSNSQALKSPRSPLNMLKNKLPSAPLMKPRSPRSTLAVQNDDESNPVVSMSTRTSQKSLSDGSVEVTTETKTVRADGTEQTKVEKKFLQATGSSVKTTPRQLRIGA